MFSSLLWHTVDLHVAKFKGPKFLDCMKILYIEAYINLTAAPQALLGIDLLWKKIFQTVHYQILLLVLMSVWVSEEQIFT